MEDYIAQFVPRNRVVLHWFGLKFDSTLCMMSVATVLPSPSCFAGLRV